ncbi:hypothetical protein PIB30_030654 [Stylosanthes scabra]|uniref:Uncharacterized protein n=1 Tax=Stylosanthes scabra TaxID=79078 RepID=A0ABU6Z8G2_9FABA|nr:hypothetical protein [Stylosanthes scabra]
MKAEERKRRFNEAIVKILYPSSPEPEPEPSPPPIQQDLQPLDAFTQRSLSHVISESSDEYENASTSGDEEHASGSGTVKLTRAQRKKIRKKKLKEDAIRRGNLIGPLLPHTQQVPQDAPPVRSNASTEPGLGDGAPPATSNKTKKRRMAKKFAKDMAQTSSSAPSVHTNDSTV